MASSVLPPAVLVSADGGDGGGSGGIPAAFLGGVEMGEDEDADLQSALALSMQQAPALEAVGSDGGEVSSSSAAAAAAAESIATDAGAEVQQQPAEGEEAAAVAQLSELFGDAVSDEEALRALRDRHGNLELAFGDLSSRLGS